MVGIRYLVNHYCAELMDDRKMDDRKMDDLLAY
jgi:hypothetical protein